MSLNFVSSSVLSSTDGVSHNTETPIANPASNAYNSLTHRSSTQSPLFEQLRKNQQEAQDNYDEVTRAMRGTRTLDDEDVAHLQSIENVREDRDRELRRREETELEMYRAAKMEKEMTVTVASEAGEETVAGASESGAEASEQIKSLSSKATGKWPKIILTKKRRRKLTPQVPQSGTEEDENCSKKIVTNDRSRKGITHDSTASTQTQLGKQDTSPTNNSNKNSKPATFADSKTDSKTILGGLLGDYESDSDDSD